MKPLLLLLAIMTDRFADLAESDLASLLDQKNSENATKATKVAYNVFREYLKEKKLTKSHLFHQKKSWHLIWENSTLKCGKGMVSFAPNLHSSGNALAFSSSSVHTRLISSKTQSFLEPMQFIKRKFQSLNGRKSSLTTQTTNKQRWHKETVWKWIV